MSDTIHIYFILIIRISLAFRDKGVLQKSFKRDHFEEDLRENLDMSSIIRGDIKTNQSVYEENILDVFFLSLSCVDID